ncbi:MAG: glycosyltransferase [Elusimicrobia bacterium]|nr:glycosyltransferase [Elusimicrobiota bacterium]
MDKTKIKNFFDNWAETRDIWLKKNRYYHKNLLNLFSFNIPENSTILEIGCSTGELLNNLKPSNGAGIDISSKSIELAKNKYPHLNFITDDIEVLRLNERFDYIIMQDLLGNLTDLWQAFRNFKKLTKPETRIVISYYNYLWEPLILLAEFLGLKNKQLHQNWLSMHDIENLLYLNDYEVIKKGYRFLMPFYIPLISDLINRCAANIPLIKNFCMIQFIVAKEISSSVPPSVPPNRELSVSIIIPARNEKGNIEELIKRIPDLGKHTEIIFVDGNSNDETPDTINGMIKKYPQKDIKLILQGGAFGKADAVRKGFDIAKGDILMILDADITVMPEDLSKFYLAITEGKGEFINGSRLVYPMEREAMRTLNILGNKFFSMIFTWTLEQRIKDTLCGTKVLLRENYLKIKKGRKYFGDFDPFGDFDLLFGASKLNLKIVEMPVSYKERKYGITKISRFKHGLLLFKMAFTAFKKFKMNLC